MTLEILGRHLMNLDEIGRTKAERQKDIKRKGQFVKLTLMSSFLIEFGISFARNICTNCIKTIQQMNK